MKLDPWKTHFDSALTLAIGLAIVLGTIAATMTIANAAECSQSLEHVSYSANFSMKPSSPQMTIQIGTPKGAPASSHELIAQIISANGDCKAVCRVNAVERNEKTHAPASMSLDCRENTFEEFAAPAQLVWETTQAGDPEIRFGTWLSGYSVAALRAPAQAR